jgi:hypothetical protein
VAEFTNDRATVVRSTSAQAADRERAATVTNTVLKGTTLMLVKVASVKPMDAVWRSASSDADHLLRMHVAAGRRNAVGDRRVVSRVENAVALSAGVVGRHVHRSLSKRARAAGVSVQHQRGPVERRHRGLSWCLPALASTRVTLSSTNEFPDAVGGSLVPSRNSE